MGWAEAMVNRVDRKPGHYDHLPKLLESTGLDAEAKVVELYEAEYGVSFWVYWHILDQSIFDIICDKPIPGEVMISAGNSIAEGESPIWKFIGEFEKIYDTNPSKVKMKRELRGNQEKTT